MPAAHLQSSMPPYLHVPWPVALQISRAPYLHFATPISATANTMSNWMLKYELCQFFVLRNIVIAYQGMARVDEQCCGITCIPSDLDCYPDHSGLCNLGLICVPSPSTAQNDDLTCTCSCNSSTSGSTDHDQSSDHADH